MANVNPPGLAGWCNWHRRALFGTSCPQGSPPQFRQRSMAGLWDSSNPSLTSALHQKSCQANIPQLASHSPAAGARTRSFLAPPLGCRLDEVDDQHPFEARLLLLIVTNCVSS